MKDSFADGIVELFGKRLSGPQVRGIKEGLSRGIGDDIVVNLLRGRV